LVSFLTISGAQYNKVYKDGIKRSGLRVEVPPEDATFLQRVTLQDGGRKKAKKAETHKKASFV